MNNTLLTTEEFSVAVSVAIVLNRGESIHNIIPDERTHAVRVLYYISMLKKHLPEYCFENLKNNLSSRLLRSIDSIQYLQ